MTKPRPLEQLAPPAGEWRRVPGYGAYSVSSDGRVWRHDAPRCDFRNRLVAILITKLGYPLVHAVSDSGEYKVVYVHHLVAAAFIGPCPPERQVNHLDGDKTNNRRENLEYTTVSENARHAYRLGLRLPNRKLTDEQIEILRTAHGSQSEIARQVGVCQQYVSMVRLGQRRKVVSP